MSSFDRSSQDTNIDILAKKIKSSRRWINVNHSRPASGDIDFTIISWNILSQDLIEVHRDFYKNCTNSSLDWSRRRSKILKYLFNSPKKYKLICLQELNHIHYEDDFLPHINEHGYKSIYLKRGSSKQDGCAIIYHQETFELDSYETVNLGNPSVLDVQKQRENVGIIASFRPKAHSSSRHSDRSTSGKFIVATTHLFFNPNRGDIKVLQLRILLAEIWKAATVVSNGQVKQLPIILCGDFNLLPNSLLYNFIVEGTLVSPNGVRTGDLSGQCAGSGRGSYINFEDLFIPAIGSDSCYLSHSHKCEANGSSSPPNHEETNGCPKVSHKFSFSPVIPLIHPKSGEPFASTSVEDSVCLVDYIFYTQSSNLQVESKLSLISYYELPTVSQVQSFGPLPNFLIPSDHLPVEARFLFRPK